MTTIESSREGSDGPYVGGTRIRAARQVEGPDPPLRACFAEGSLRSLARLTLSRGPKQTCRMAIRELNVHRGWFTAR